MKIILLIFCFALSQSIFSQYEFTHIKDIDCTEIKSQAKTGTCWSFATSSFIESELMRQGKGEHNLSEMYVVRNIYSDKAKNFVLRQGKANFSQGSLSHDLIRIIAKGGVMPESVYSGLLDGEESHNHSEMEKGLSGFLEGITKSKKLSPKWSIAFEKILDAYMGEVPSNFTYNGKVHTAKSLTEYLAINPEDYVSVTSFSHHPFGQDFILEIPDNYSNGSFLNLEIEALEKIVDKAIDKGYTVAWDGDVSEPGFSAKEGIAVSAVDSKREDLFKNPGKEIVVNQKIRQAMFESYETTDDHLMHIVGKAKDQTGTEYYIIKNSWGEISPYKGYLYMSKPYFRLKTVALMVHKDLVKKY